MALARLTDVTTLATTPPPAPAGNPPEALWHLAYAITGDRGLASGVVADALAHAASGTITPARLRREVVALARARAARVHDRLWTALRPLPRRRRAEIVLRLARAPAGPPATFP